MSWVSWAFTINLFLHQLTHKSGKRFLARDCFALGEVVECSWKNDRAAIRFGFWFRCCFHGAIKALGCLTVK